MQNGELASALFQLSPNPRQRIVVVDDEEDLRRFNTEVLRPSFDEVNAAADGAAAWVALQLNKYTDGLSENSKCKLQIYRNAFPTSQFSVASYSTSPAGRFSVPVMTAPPRSQCLLPSLGKVRSVHPRPPSNFLESF